MLNAGEGAIINIVDLAAFEPWPNYMAHAVGKSAQLALNRQLALELAPQVTVNAIAPGPVLPPPDYSQKKIDSTAERTLLNRWGTAEDIAQTVVFLVQSDYITGEVIRVDGGEHFGHRKAGS
jgi:3-oxoacyl-[acyl-carrier protein] reductase/pteridine reductase